MLVVSCRVVSDMRFQWEVLRNISALTLEFAGAVILYGVNSVANALMQSE